SSGFGITQAFLYGQIWHREVNYEVKNVDERIAAGTRWYHILNSTYGLNRGAPQYYTWFMIGGILTRPSYVGNLGVHRHPKVKSNWYEVLNRIHITTTMYQQRDPIGLSTISYAVDDEPNDEMEEDLEEDPREPTDEMEEDPEEDPKEDPRRTRKRTLPRSAGGPRATQEEKCGSHQYEEMEKDALLKEDAIDKCPPWSEKSIKSLQVTGDRESDYDDLASIRISTRRRIQTAKFDMFGMSGDPHAYPKGARDNTYVRPSENPANMHDAEDRGHEGTTTTGDESRQSSHSFSLILSRPPDEVRLRATFHTLEIMQVDKWLMREQSPEIPNYQVQRKMVKAKNAKYGYQPKNGLDLSPIGIVEPIQMAKHR
ncbi:hypothetical protein H5410_055681, partial [Solanum commersonii]